MTSQVDRLGLRNHTGQSQEKCKPKKPDDIGKAYDFPISTQFESTPSRNELGAGALKLPCHLGSTKLVKCIHESLKQFQIYMMS